jgi:5-methyltetrahydrofolate--homocysteine methyltransferase
MISGTITDASGRTLSGQTAEAFWNSLNHIRPLSFGLNCALGAGELRQYVEELSHLCDCFVSAHPNAGLPNAFGGYDETPEQLAAEIATGQGRDSSISSAAAAAPRPTHRRHCRWCCRRQAAPRAAAERKLRLSGLEPFNVGRTRCSSTSASGPTSPARGPSPG